LTNKRSIKIVLACIWAVVVLVLLGFAVKLLQEFISTPEEAPSIVQPPPPPPEPKEREVKLFFADNDASSLLPEKRFIRLGSGVRADAVALMEELIKGPQLEGLSPTIPADTRLLNAFNMADVLVLDFSQELQANHSGGSAGELTTVYSIVNTMTQNLRGIKKVQILIEGQEVDSLAGHLDLTRPLVPDTKWMKTLPREVSAS
jgi:germination protein M